MRRAVFVSGLSSAVIVASCGRQVTPSPSEVNGLPKGYMSVKFNVQSAFNFQSDSYVIVFNTANASSSNTVTPVAAAVQTGFAGYSLAIVVGGSGGAATAQAFSYFRPSNTSQLPVLYPINATPQQLQFLQNSNGTGSQFQVIFDRIIASFNANATATPSASPSASASASPTASPSAAGSATPSPSASGVTVTNYWTYNFFTIQGTIQQFEGAQSVTIVDSLGSGGATDATYQSTVLDVTTPLDTTFYTQAGTHPTTSDAIAGGEIANNP